MAIIAAFFKKAAGYVLAALAFLGALALAWRAGASVGRAKQETADNDAEAVRQVNEARAQAGEQVQAIKHANDESNEVNKLDSAAIADELRADWTRD